MAHNPSATAFGGLVTLLNFTHYDTDDLIRLLEAPYTARLRAGFLDTDTAPNKTTELHICYSQLLAGGAKARVSGPFWRHNGIRVLPPHKIIDNPIEALVDNSKEMPLIAVRQLLDIANRLFGGRASYNRYAPQDIDIGTLSLGVRVAINDAPAAKKPNGYRRRAYALQHSVRASRSARYRMRYAVRGMASAELSVIRFLYHGKAAGVAHLVKPDLLDRMRRVREEVKKIEEELRDIYDHVEQETA
jgi:hypothetical protein